ncbi:ankyrin repeat domain-containing protein [Alloacidobacterium sp.]|uniref:ankyrin repeat domain-containing protein n=1 Tax=Alloacidobacterium sp. TaxID=2951999 RepID=UPI002D5ACC7B|nr:ankyrin repeat domain-containing protein [Alloacidobacterium sp.]HYK36180.1 ankyrin repeat domain-containing protein [Alloacidobacterium sp.]
MPNPQEVLPLPSRPSLERYKKLAKELVKVFKSGQETAVGEWTNRWIEALAKHTGGERSSIDKIRDANRTERFALEKLSEGYTLSNAQFVIARSHGFESWPKFAKHLGALAKRDSSVTRFEAAADAIVTGKMTVLKRLLRQDPKVVHMRSTREHRATLLHYVGANGVENYRQKSPKNIVQITNLLLKAGADIDAPADIYGGGATTLGLASTSIHPELAGVQEALLQTLLDHNATIDQPGDAGNNDPAVLGCLANGRIKAAVFLASHGAGLTLESAAGIGRLDLVQSYFGGDGTLKPNATNKQMRSGFLYACGYGHTKIVEFLLNKGIDLSTHGDDRQTGLHRAVIGGHLDTIRLLLQRNPLLEAKNIYGGTVLDQALWSAAHGGDPEHYIKIIETLIAAGAELPQRHVPVNRRIDDWLEKYGSHAEPMWYWSVDEKPRT